MTGTSESAVTAEMPYPSLSGRTQISAPGSFQPSTRDMCRAQADCAMTVSFERPSSSFERLHAALIFSLTGAMALSASPPSFAAFLRHSSTSASSLSSSSCSTKALSSSYSTPSPSSSSRSTILLFHSLPDTMPAPFLSTTPMRSAIDRTTRLPFHAGTVVFSATRHEPTIELMHMTEKPGWKPSCFSEPATSSLSGTHSGMYELELCEKMRSLLTYSWVVNMAMGEFEVRPPN
mmetsp:Transcript_12392/g.40807  ORF Transcript_12392/g.40807 Transcript_12392/m.40807 type:complete len:234 (+) Transcript_12392:665-1366(+)